MPAWWKSHVNNQDEKSQASASNGNKHKHDKKNKHTKGNNGNRRPYGLFKKQLKDPPVHSQQTKRPQRLRHTDNARPTNNVRAHTEHTNTRPIGPTKHTNTRPIGPIKHTTTRPIRPTEHTNTRPTHDTTTRPTQDTTTRPTQDTNTRPTRNPTRVLTTRASTLRNEVIPRDCIIWFDGSRSCYVQDAQFLICTRMYGSGFQEQYCRKFQDGRICQSPTVCIQTDVTETRVRTTLSADWNSSAIPTWGNFSIEVPNMDSHSSVKVPFVEITLAVVAMAMILLAALIVVGKFALTKRKRKRARNVAADNGISLLQNATTTKHLKKLRSALNKHPMNIQWADDGKSFHVPDRHRFECDVLGDASVGFKTKNFKTWAQKLRRHGFKLHRGTGSKVVGGRYSRDDGLFTRDHPELDAQIPRGRAAKYKKTSRKTHLVHKLREAFALYPDIIHWAEDGVVFRVKDLRAFESKVLADERVGFLCSTYLNWARNMRNRGFEAVHNCTVWKNSPRVWRHAGGYFLRDRPGHLKGINEIRVVPVAKRCRTENDVPLRKGIAVPEVVTAKLPPTPQPFPIGATPTADHLSCGKLSFGSTDTSTDTMLESASLIRSVGDHSELVDSDSDSCSLSFFDHEYNTMGGTLVNDISELLSATESDLQRQLQVCQED